MDQRHDTYTAFVGHRRIVTGPPAQVAAGAARAMAAGESRVLVFDDRTGRQVDVDLRGPRLAIAPPDAASAPQARGRGRPKLGVVAREVTLLPRHWDWLAGQPGGASAALRRLVDQARREGAEADETRLSQQSAYAAMSALAGDLPAFEEASRALFASDRSAFVAATGVWPQDVRAYVTRLADGAWARSAGRPSP